MQEIVIVGAGIIGVCTAQQIAARAGPGQCKITILEASANGAAQGASGKAGGLVALWAYPANLVRLSFAEHERLAKEHGASYGWRYVNTGSWAGQGSVASSPSGKSLEKEYGLEPAKRRQNSAKRKRNDGKRVLPSDLDWLDEDHTDSYSQMASLKESAQVHPYLFTQKMLSLAQAKGAELVVDAKVTAIETGSDGKVSGVKYSHEGKEKTMPCDKVIVTAGAWSPLLVSRLPITKTRAHSVVIEADVSPYVLFTQISDTHDNTQSSPEIYARPDGTAYACGEGDDSPLPATVDQVEVDAKACDVIINNVTSVSEKLRDGKVVAKQACFLPLGGPIIGEMPDTKDLFVATGHTCWGICNAPGTGKAMAELILDGKIKSADLSRMHPRYFL